MGIAATNESEFPMDPQDSAYCNSTQNQKKDGPRPTHQRAKTTKPTWGTSEAGLWESFLSAFPGKTKLMPREDADEDFWAALVEEEDELQRNLGGTDDQKHS